MEAQQEFAGVQSAVEQVLSVVRGEPVVEFPGCAGQTATVHRADGDLVIEQAEERQLFEHVRRSEHAVDPRVGEHTPQAPEQFGAVRHRERVAADTERAACRMVGGDDQQAPVVGQRRPAGTLTQRVPQRARTRESRVDDAGVVLVGQPHEASFRPCRRASISAAVGMASEHSRREATIAPAALA